jgi:hypothetical protein
MKRRLFLQSLAAAVTGAVFDPERLLWVPGQKTFVFVTKPPVRCVSIAELVAVTFDAVMAERRKQGQLFWSDDALLRELVAERYDELSVVKL